MILSEEEIADVEKIAKKNEAVGKLLEFYKETQIDGLKALRVSLNKKLIDISASVDSAQIDDNDDKTFERIDRIVTSLKKLPKENEEKEQEVVKKGHEGKAIV